MAKCSECGYLAIWDSTNTTFYEAEKYFRENGRRQNRVFSLNNCMPACFIQKDNLEKEWYQDLSLSTISEPKDRIVAICEKSRNCDGYTPWLQGFHPKEHKQMLLNDEMVKAQQRHAEASLKTAVWTARWTAIAVLVGALVAWYSANLAADATIEAVKMQIKSDRELAEKK